MSKSLLFLMKEAQAQGVITAGGAIIRNPSSLEQYRSVVSTGWVYDNQPIRATVEVLESMEKWYNGQR